jgi:hypothetical protein
MVHRADQVKSALDTFVKEMGLVLDAARENSSAVGRPRDRCGSGGCPEPLHRPTVAGSPRLTSRVDDAVRIADLPPAWNTSTSHAA